MIDPLVTNAIAEIEHVKHECSTFLSDMRHSSPNPPGTAFPDIFRLMAVPMLYSTWERCFTLCHAVSLRLLRQISSQPNSLAPTERALWLMKAPCYQSLVQNLLNQSASTEATRPKRGRFNALADFLAELDIWSSQVLDPAIDTGTLVMTFSNVNPEVVELNARAIGIWDFAPFQQMKFGRLNDLVGQRNGIGHGATLSPIPNGQFEDLWQYTDKLIQVYCDTFIDWLQVRFPAKKPPSIGSQIISFFKSLLDIFN